MRLALVIALCAASANAQIRRVAYPGADFGDYKPIPKFDKGYLLFTQRTCELTVFHPSGKKLFTSAVQAPGGLPCLPNDAAIDRDGTVAVTVSFSGPQGFSGAILLVDANGKQIGAIDTGRYIPGHVVFDRHHAIWTAGSKRDEINSGMLDKGDYFLVRKFSKDGRESGAFLPRSLWGAKADPGSPTHGY